MTARTLTLEKGADINNAASFWVTIQNDSDITTMLYANYVSTCTSLSINALPGISDNVISYVINDNYYEPSYVVLQDEEGSLTYETISYLGFDLTQIGYAQLAIDNIKEFSLNSGIFDSSFYPISPP